MNKILTIDFGSTNTKLTAIDVKSESVIATAVAFTTIETDVRVGFENALKEIHSLCGIKEFDEKVACSSAAGGLKMVSCGLVPDLTVKASKMAATSAGAKVMRSFSYEITPNEQEEIYNLNPDIVLLCGGIDGGNKNVIVHNAKMLAEIDLPLYIIVAGNKTVAHTVSQILKDAGKYHKVCENVLPDFNNINIYPVRSAIRDLFIERIIHAKGLDEAQKMMNAEIVPTPFSVFDGAELLSLGTSNESGLGDTLFFDVGGATTDVYSMCDGEPTKATMIKGLKEPFSKRTVEGDIGVRYSLPFLMEEIDLEKAVLPDGITLSDINNWVNKCKDCSVIPSTEIEAKSDMFFARHAIEISINRHVGFVDEVYTSMGQVLVQTGKDLTNTKYIIGTGGSVINSLDKNYVLQSSLLQSYDYNLLKPSKASFLLDEKNILAAMGLVSKIDSDLALRMMKKYIVGL